MPGQLDVRSNAVSEEGLHVVRHDRYGARRTWVGSTFVHDPILNFMLTTQEEVHGERIVDVKDLPQQGPSLGHIGGWSSHLKVINIDDQHESKPGVKICPRPRALDDGHEPFRLDGVITMLFPVGTRIGMTIERDVQSADRLLQVAPRRKPLVAR